MNALDLLCAGKLLTLSGSFEPAQGEMLGDAVAVIRLRLDAECAQQLASYTGKTLHLRMTWGRSKDGEGG